MDTYKISNLYHNKTVHCLRYILQVKEEEKTNFRRTSRLDCFYVVANMETFLLPIYSRGVARMKRSHGKSRPWCAKILGSDS